VLCTAKSHGFARRVADHFGLTPLLSGLYGSELYGRFEDKAELIARRCQVKQPQREMGPDLPFARPYNLCPGYNRSWFAKRKLDKATTTQSCPQPVSSRCNP
jgi:hypothetical protein